MVDARYGRGGTTTPAPHRRAGGTLFTQARRRGKLLLLDTDGGPTLGIRFGMTGGLVVDGAKALDRLRYGPGLFEEKWVRARVSFADGGHLWLHDPAASARWSWRPTRTDSGPTRSPSPCPSRGRL
jgi:formamidopyrimidine-DNA glycosylase